MDTRNRKTQSRRKSVVKPPKKKTKPGLSRDEQRSIDKKKLARKRKMQKKLFSVALAVGVMCIGVVLVFSLFFKINTISVEGENVYSDKMVTEKSGVEFDTNLFRANEKAVSQKLSKELPYIKNVTLKRKLPDTLIINVETTKEVAAITKKGVFVLIDETGKILDKDASILRENVAVVNNVKIKDIVEGEQIQLDSEKKTDALITLLNALKNSGLELLTEIDLKSLNDIKIKYDDRITFEVGSLTNIETKLARGVAALEKENEINAYSKGTLDLKTEPYVYFKAGSEENKKKENAKK